MTYARIAGTGSYLPKKTVSNADLEKILDTSDKWILSRSGIANRHIAAPDETCHQLAKQAALAAFEASGNREVDLIIVATTTPDKHFPSTACLLQKALGIADCPAFDVQAVCTGFIYALDIANRFIKTKGATRALVVGSEVMSRIVNWNDRTTSILFGDGAGAVILEASDHPGIYSTHLHANGNHEHLLHVPRGPGGDPEASPYIEMQGKEVFKMAVQALEKIVDETLQANGFQQSDIDWLVPHQANRRIIEATARKLKLPMDKVVTTIAEHGNTSAASVPLALDTAIRDGRIQRGVHLMMEAFGGGFTWGSALLKY